LKEQLVKVMGQVEKRSKEELFRMWHTFMEMQRERALQNK
jgi:hypothetical protein